MAVESGQKIPKSRVEVPTHNGVTIIKTRTGERMISGAVHDALEYIGLSLPRRGETGVPRRDVSGTIHDALKAVGVESPRPTMVSPRGPVREFSFRFFEDQKTFS